MKERPIIFRGDMVRAILDGRKTQTRRLVKYRNYAEHGATVYPHECPYGLPGDRLWVRETWAHVNYDGGTIGSAELNVWMAMMHGDKGSCTDATNQDALGERIMIYRAEMPGTAPKWHPSIFMPRFASRITLEIMKVRVQRLQEISEDDAKAEGIEQSNEGLYGEFGPGFSWRGGFRDLWNFIHSKDDYSWKVNPFVWTITFRISA